jgi:hypothetical protein
LIYLMNQHVTSLSSKWRAVGEPTYRAAPPAGDCCNHPRHVSFCRLEEVAAEDGVDVGVGPAALGEVLGDGGRPAGT